VNAIVLLALAIVFAACASSPVGVTHVDPSDVHRRLTRSAISTRQLSDHTHNVLLEANLDALFERDPEKALEHLHDLAVSGSGGPPQLFAAAEASFLHAERSRKRPYYLAAAVYAWAYLFPEDPTESPSPFDPRFRLAANLYNRGLTSALEAGEKGQIVLTGGTADLPFGQLDVAFDPTQLVWQGRRMTGFAPIAEYRVHGLHAHYRKSGLGAPMAASLAPLASENQPKDLLRAELTVPATVILRSPRSRTALAWPPFESTLEVHVPDITEEVEIAGRRVPLETEPTAVLAYSLADSPIWEQEYSRFFGVPFAQGEQSELYATVPHRRGRIPVVFVHGTASSFGRWAEMYNRLAADWRLRDRYEFWFFSYDSGNQLGWSAMLLRESLASAVRLLDPEGTDPGLRRMVVIGHSQGGLLTKMTVIDSGSRFWDLVFKQPPESLDVSSETRDLLRRLAFMTPLPFVKRVVFLATPHRGSSLTVGRFAEWAADWIRDFVKAPVTVTRALTELATKRDALVLASADAIRPVTSVDQMNPRNRTLRTLAEIPIAPGVAANSVISVNGSGPVEEDGDGVVDYRSAHLDGVESELVVHSGHSLQDHPETVEEVRRILLYHARDVP
jgi:pimeloyl-ACP methyl ester carboxylesterase